MPAEDAGDAIVVTLPGHSGFRLARPRVAPNPLAWERVAAIVLVVCAHAGLALMASRDHRKGSGAAEHALEVVFVIPPPEPPPSVPPRRAALPDAPVVSRTSPEASPAPTVADERSEPGALQARIIERAPSEPASDDWTLPGHVDASATPFAARDRLQRVAPVLPGGGGPDRFRMRPPRSPERVVKSIAAWVGLAPPGYTTDSCPGISAAIAAWQTAGDRRGQARMAHEMERERKYCR